MRTSRLFALFAVLWFAGAPAASARFLQTDPIGTKDDPNLYQYVGNDPVNKTDPTGLCDAGICTYEDPGLPAADASTFGGLDAALGVRPSPARDAAVLRASQSSATDRMIIAKKGGEIRARPEGREVATGNRAGPSNVLGRFFRGSMRQNALEKTRDANGDLRCSYCGRVMRPEPGRTDSATVDHIVPYSKGGPTSPGNAAGACLGCNSSKQGPNARCLASRVPRMTEERVVVGGYSFVRNKATICCTHVLTGDAACAVAHHSDGDLQIVCAKEQHSEDQIAAVELEHLLALHPQLLSLPLLPQGCHALRSLDQDGWTVHELSPEDD